MSLSHATPPVVPWRPPHLRSLLERLVALVRTHALPYLRSLPRRLARAAWATGVVLAVTCARVIGWFAAEPRRLVVATVGIAVCGAVGGLAGYGAGRVLAGVTVGLLDYFDLGVAQVG